MSDKIWQRKRVKGWNCLATEKHKKGGKEVGGVGRKGNDGKLLDKLHCSMQINLNTMRECCNSFFLF